MTKTYVIPFNSSLGGLLEKLGDLGNKISYNAKVHGDEVEIIVRAPFNYMFRAVGIIKDYQ